MYWFCLVSVVIWMQVPQNYDVRNRGSYWKSTSRSLMRKYLSLCRREESNLYNARNRWKIIYLTLSETGRPERNGSPPS
ncbi:unnamed protein product [Allacma fusca]|uniref:Secreted protein n=1 Tax=Allacma fusca TaxID=39272 RepID=A0A8J2L6W0_9HEXA|nr:unnamed protein product [Allacma fusca]